MSHVTILTVHVIILLFIMSGNIEWEDKRKQRCFVMWRTPDEWAALIFKWVTIQSLDYSDNSDILYVCRGVARGSPGVLLTPLPPPLWGNFLSQWHWLMSCQWGMKRVIYVLWNLPYLCTYFTSLSLPWYSPLIHTMSPSKINMTIWYEAWVWHSDPTSPLKNKILATTFIWCTVKHYLKWYFLVYI